jgi:hypothetical protein
MTDERIIAYLLEELPEDDLERFEEECFAQESWPVELTLVEEDLIEAYLRNELPAERRRRFEQKYLVTEAGRERVSMAAALLRHVDEHHNAAQQHRAVPPPEPTWTERFRALWNRQRRGFSAALALVTITIILGTIWISRQPTSSPQSFAAVTLTISNSNRADAAQIGKLKLSPETEALKVSLTLPQPQPAELRYRVELDNATGEKKVSKVIGQNSQSVEVLVPTAQLAREQYAFRLFAIKPDSSEQRISGSYFLLIE